MRRGLVPVLNACVRDGGGRGPKGLTASAIYQALPIPGLIIGSSAQAAGDSAAAVFRRNKVLVAIKIKLSVEIACAAASPGNRLRLVQLTAGIARRKRPSLF